MRHRGFSVIELLVVIIIVTILAAGILGGYKNFQQHHRMKSSIDRVLSTFHLARSLAISNNAVYHIRIEDYEVVTVPATITDPVVAKLTNENYVSVYAYVRSADAIRVQEEPHPLSDDWWNSGFNLTDTKTGAVQTNPYNPGRPLNNRRIERNKLEMQTFLGVQNPVKAVEKGALLSFYPDGTASESIVFFVTEADAKLYDEDGKVYEARDNKSLPLLERQKIADYRRNAINGAKRADGGSFGDGEKIRVIQVLKGGMIKLLKQEKL
jgi:prepilin-type N-terminal cleavage/methylation domain-containing protein